MRRPLTLGLALAVILAGCAGQDDEIELIARTPTAETGRAIAEMRCASCHAIDASLASPREGAPPFMVLRERYLATSLQRKLEAMRETEHSQMPPLLIHWDEIESLMAYMRELPEG